MRVVFQHGNAAAALCIATALLMAEGSRAQSQPGQSPPQGAGDVRHATLQERHAAREVSTEELRGLLRNSGALLLDTRPHLEWALGHIPGALNVAPKPGIAMSLYTSDVAEITRLTDGNRRRPVILYCNGPFCGKSKRVAEELLAAGFTDVSRYQLGAPVWRALGGVIARNAFHNVAYFRGDLQRLREALGEGGP